MSSKMRLSADREPNGEVAVVIVNYNTAALAVEAVRSVLTHSRTNRKIHVYLVDNASTAGDAETLAMWHADECWGTRVSLYAETENHGFGRGNNIVLDRLLQSNHAPDYVLLLNPDARLVNDVPDILASFLDTSPQTGCAGARISQPSTGPVTAAFRFPTTAIEFVSSANVGALTRLAGGKTLWHAADIATGAVDWVAGAAVMFRTSALRDVGTFDPDFFLYFEEVELMWRLSQNGWDCWHVAEAHVEHEEGASTDVRSGDTERKRRPAYWYQSQAMYFAKTATAPIAITRALARLCGSGLHRLTSLLRGRTPDLPKGFFFDYLRWVVLRSLALPLGATAQIQSANATAPQSRAQRDIESGEQLTHAVNDGCANRNPEGISLWALIAEDFRNHASDAFSQGFWALFWHRFGNARMTVKSRLLRLPLSLMYHAGYKATQWFCGIMLPYTVVVGRRVKLEHFGSMILVARAIGDDVTIRQNTTFGVACPSRPNHRPTIGDRVDIGAGAVIIGDLCIGADAVIGANSVVNRTQPPGSLVVGAPARVIGSK